jgi:uncharacterized protein YraI
MSLEEKVALIIKIGGTDVWVNPHTLQIDYRIDNVIVHQIGTIGPMEFGQIHSHIDDVDCVYCGRRAIKVE